MALPVIESITFTQDADVSETTSTFNMPANRPDGDLYILVARKDDGDIGFTIPSPEADHWNILTPQVIDDGDSVTHATWWWIGASEPATYTLSHDQERWRYTVYRISGFNTTTEIGGYAVSTGVAAGAGNDTITMHDYRATGSGDMMVFWDLVSDESKVVSASYTDYLYYTGSGGGGGGRIGYGVGIVTGSYLDGQLVSGSAATWTITEFTAENYAAMTFQVNGTEDVGGVSDIFSINTIGQANITQINFITSANISHVNTILF